MTRPDMTRQDLETLQDTAASDALKARQRIENAVNSGELPVWVLETCEVWERSSLLYGAAMSQLRRLRAVAQSSGAAVGTLH